MYRSADENALSAGGSSSGASPSPDAARARRVAAAVAARSALSPFARSFWSAQRHVHVRVAVATSSACGAARR